MQAMRITVERGNHGLFYATSEDERGLLVAEPTIEQLFAAIPQAVRDLDRARNTNTRWW